jgi:hypothetical protein
MILITAHDGAATRARVERLGAAAYLAGSSPKEES